MDITCAMEMRKAFTILAKNLKVRDDLEDLNANVRIILKLI
jgi:hypothetical protein